MFEYKVTQFEGTGYLEKELNSVGEEGWRLVHTTRDSNCLLRV
jgi:hypothetical protein